VGPNGKPIESESSVHGPAEEIVQSTRGSGDLYELFSPKTCSFAVFIDFLTSIFTLSGFYRTCNDQQFFSRRQLPVPHRTQRVSSGASGRSR
jgi:hypothetical protein